MKIEGLKVGDRVAGSGNNRNGPAEMTGSYVGMDDNCADIAEIKTDDGVTRKVWLGSLVRIDGKESKPAPANPPLLVRGNVPSVNVNIGCVSIPFDKFEKTLRRLKVAVKYITIDVSIRFKGEIMSPSDIQEAEAWWTDYKKKNIRR